MPTSTSWAVWGSVFYPRKLRHTDEGNRTRDFPIIRRWALPQSHSHSQTRQQVTATLLRNDTLVAVNFNMNEFKIHCYILSWRSWTEIVKFNKLRKTFSRFLKAEKVFFSQVTQGLVQWLVPPHCTAVHEWLCGRVTALVKVKEIPHANTNSIHYTSYNEEALNSDGACWWYVSQVVNKQLFNRTSERRKRLLDKWKHSLICNL